MRISRKKRPKKSLVPHYQINDRIKADEVRILDIENNNLGIFSIKEALEQAREQELDLIEINPKSQPPVCQIDDFSHFHYRKEKEIKKQAQRAHEGDLKGIRLSVRISDHDLGVRLKQAEKFLGRGDKIKMELTMRGRENAKPSLAFGIMEKFFKSLEEKIEIKYEQDPIKQGNRVTATIARK